MSQIAINRVTNANVYLNGNSMLGKASEVNLPQLKTLLSDHMALGLYGKVELPTGLDKLEATIKWTSYYGDVLAATANPFATHEIQVRSSIDQYSAAGRTGQVAAVCYIRGTFKDPSLGNFKQHDNVETDAKINVTAVRFEIDGKPVLEIDVLANIFKIQGVDVLQTYRQNIGG